MLATERQESIAVRVNVDESALTDPRFRRLARYLAIAFFEAIGRCVPVWMTAYNRRTATLTTEDVDIAADRDGFAGAMVRAELADRVDDTRVRVRGVTDRIQFLVSQVAKARKRWDSHGTAGGDADAHTDASAPAEPEHDRGTAGGDAYSLALDQAQALDPTREMARVAVAAVNELSGREYRADSDLTLRMCRALVRARIAPEHVVPAVAIGGAK